MQAGQKRKRGADCPRITFHADERTFDRLFKEESLHELRNTVKAKLGLPKHSDVVLKQLRNGKTIDLEDEEDFDAFHLVAHSQAHVEVQVHVKKPGHRPSQPESSRHKSVPPEQPISARLSSRFPFSRSAPSEARPFFRAKSQPPQPLVKRPSSTAAGTVTTPDSESISVGPSLKKKKVNGSDPLTQPGVSAVTLDHDAGGAETTSAIKRGRKRKRHVKTLAQGQRAEENLIHTQETMAASPLTRQEAEDQSERPPKKKTKKQKEANTSGEEVAMSPPEADEAPRDLVANAMPVEENVVIVPPFQEPGDQSGKPPKKKKKKQKGTTITTEEAEGLRQDVPQPEPTVEGLEDMPAMPPVLPTDDAPHTDSQHELNKKKKKRREELQRKDLNLVGEPALVITTGADAVDVEMAPRTLPTAAPAPADQAPVSSKPKPKAPSFSLFPPSGVEMTPRKQSVHNEIQLAYAKVFGQQLKGPSIPKKSKAATYKALFASKPIDPSDDAVGLDSEPRPKRKASKSAKKDQPSVVPDADEPVASTSQLPSIVVAKPDKKQKKAAVVVDDQHPSGKDSSIPDVSASEAPTKPKSKGPRGDRVVVELKSRKRKEPQEVDASVDELVAVDTPDATESLALAPLPELTKGKRKVSKAVKDAVTVDTAVQEGPASDEPPPEKTERRTLARGKKVVAPAADEPSAQQIAGEGPAQETPNDPEHTVTSIEGWEGVLKPQRKSKRTEKGAGTTQTPGEPEPSPSLPVEGLASESSRPKRKTRAPKKDVIPIVEEPRAVENNCASSKVVKISKPTQPESDIRPSVERRPPRLSRGSKKTKTPAFVEDSDAEPPSNPTEDLAPSQSAVGIVGADTSEIGFKPAKLSRGMKGKAKALAPSTSDNPLGGAVKVPAAPAREPSVEVLPDGNMQVDEENTRDAPLAVEPRAPVTLSETMVDQVSDQSGGRPPVEAPALATSSVVNESDDPRSLTEDLPNKSMSGDVPSDAQPGDKQSIADADARSESDRPSEVTEVPAAEAPSRTSLQPATPSPDLNPSQIDGAFPFPFSLPSGLGDMTDFANVDLDALIRGPPTSQITSADLLSSPESSDEGSGEDEEDETQELLDEDMEEPRAARRSSRKPAVLDSSESEESEDESRQSGAEKERKSHSSNSREPSPITAGQYDHSFKSVDRMVESEREFDNLGDTAFHDAFAADEEPIQHLNEEERESTPKPDASDSNEKVVTEDQQQEPDLNAQEAQTNPELGSATPQAIPPTAKGITQDIEATEGVGKANSIGGELSVPGQLPTPDGSEVNEEEIQASQRAKLRTRGKGRVVDNSTPKPQPVTQSVIRSTKKPASKATPKPLQALSSFAPPRLVSQAAANRQLRSHRKAAQSQDSIMGASQWEVLGPAATSSSPGPEGDFSQMVDELHSDAPDLANEASDAEYPLKRPPLFVLTESQPPFPYSQWQDESQAQENATAKVAAKDDAILNDSENEEGEVEASVTPAIRRQQPPASKFRRLTDIARDHSMFSTPSQRRLSRASLLTKKAKMEDMYGRLGGGEESDSGSDSGDDSDERPASHIPRNRRAGISKAKK